MKFWCAALIVSAALATPASARHRHHHHQPATFSYGHNYGPGLQPGTFAYYDGPLSVRCAQGAAAYRGQDGRRHPLLLSKRDGRVIRRTDFTTR